MTHRHRHAAPGPVSLRVQGLRPRIRVRLSPEVRAILRQGRSLAMWSAPVRPFYPIPAMAGMATGAAALAFCTWTVPGTAAVPVERPPITVTVLDHLPWPEPATERPPSTALLPVETREPARASDIPPPPAIVTTAPACLPFAARLAAQSGAGPIPGTGLGDPDSGTPRAGAGGPGPGPAQETDLDRFWRHARGLVASCATYPAAAVRDGATGQVVLRVAVDARGRLRSVHVAESASNRALDSAAILAVKRAAPFPPEGLGPASATNSFEAMIPVRFELVDTTDGRWGLALKP